MPQLYRKKLIEVALPLDAINAASAREKSIRHGHPSTLHLWWARRPLAAARAVIFAQMVDDPSSHPEEFPTEESQEKERQRLFKIIENLVKWENTTDEAVLQQARDEIWRSWRTTCADNAEHPRADEFFNPEKLTAFHDPFAGGGALPLEAQRLGLQAYASDLNPVAVLICKAMIEIPPKFAGIPPVNPKSREEKTLLEKDWTGAQGLSEDVRYYGRWMRDEAQKRIGHLYPQVEVTVEMSTERPDLEPYLGKKLTVIAWIWARTVKSPNPAFANVDVPLATTFMLSTKKGKEAYVEPVIGNHGYRFTVKVGKPDHPHVVKNGTSAGKWAAFRCLMSDVPITYDYIRDEGKAGRIRTRLLAVVAEGMRGRVYLSPTPMLEEIEQQAEPFWTPEQSINYHPRDIKTQIYGLTKYRDIFTPRQLVALATLSDLVGEARERILKDAIATGLPNYCNRDEKGEDSASVYAQSVGVYLAFALSKQADLGNSLCGWEPIAQCPRHLFGRQAIPMIWDFAEGNPLGSSSGAWVVFVEGIAKAFAKSFQFVSTNAIGTAQQADAGQQEISRAKVVSTDPPYYDNIGYADLSDFFYVWLRRTLKPVFPELFATLAVPKSEELVATPYRHGSKEKAESFFLTGMKKAMHRIAEQAHPAFPVTIYYAFKQSERKGDSGTSSTGWETFLDAVICAGFAISGTLPMRTENSSRMMGQGYNALASSIIIVCRPRDLEATTATRREFVNALKAELPEAIAHLQHGNIAPVDLAQSAIGPGMAVYTRYEKVLSASGVPLTVREALALINQVLDEVLEEQEGEFDDDTRWAVTWFAQHGNEQGEFGDAEQLSKSKNVGVNGLVEAGILEAKSGKVRLLRRDELPDDWDLSSDTRLTVWETTQYLIRALVQEGGGGEQEAARLAAQLGAKAEVARDLAYRLYVICERNRWANEALAYNSLVVAWNEITRLAEQVETLPEQTALL
ncbi:MAG: DUF1156 domain-containing protein [Gammaproteobacteria bacterium]|nr:DUF1156 domain-containing protein [Gammaproteobacteria bacterium]